MPGHDAKRLEAECVRAQMELMLSGVATIIESTFEHRPRGIGFTLILFDPVDGKLISAASNQNGIAGGADAALAWLEMLDQIVEETPPRVEN